MKRLFLPLLFCTALAHAAPFYEGKPLAHAVIVASQDSGLDIVFLKEAGGVNAYYCECAKAGAKPQRLDQFGNAVIRSVFYAPLDRKPETSTLLVLFRLDGKQGLRAYRHDHSSGKYVRLLALQPALDRIVAPTATPNAGQVKAALAKLSPLDYSVVRGKSGNADFDAIDHTQGTVVGFYDNQGRPVDAASKDTITYKKTFSRQGERYLTASYTLYGDGDAGELPNYRLWQVGWETAPQQFAGSAEGPSVIYSLSWDDGSVVERGEYAHGKRTGVWTRSGLHEGSARGAYVNGLPDGPWHIEEPKQTEDGVYRAGKREGRWTVVNYADQDEVTGFDTYAGGQLNGPHERTMKGKLQARGNYVNGTRQGKWITSDGEGSYLDGLRDGPWILKLKDGATLRVNFVKGKKQGEAKESDASGKLRLREHYAMDVLEGERTRYMPDGTLVYQATFRNGQLDGRERAWNADGKILRLDTAWDNGKKQGMDARYYPDGKPERLTVVERGRLAAHLREYAEDGTLINDIHRCYFTEDGRERDDVCDYHRMWYANGTPESDYVFQFGQRQEGHSWYANGKVKDELLVDRAAGTSVYNTYFENGQLKCTEPRSGHGKRTVNGQTVLSYASAERDGDAICYHPNGKVASIRSYRQRIAVDCGKTFDDTGKQLSPGPAGCTAAKKEPFVFGE